MPKFALLLPHAPDRYADLGPDDYMDIIKDYVAWTEDLAARGIYQGGHKLTDDPGRKLVRSGAGIEVRQTASAELAEVLGGIMIIEAADYDAAEAVARTCPHLVHNRVIDIRQIADVGED